MAEAGDQIGLNYVINGINNVIAVRAAIMSYGKDLELCTIVV